MGRSDNSTFFLSSNFPSFKQRSKTDTLETCLGRNNRLSWTLWVQAVQQFNCWQPRHPLALRMVLLIQQNMRSYLGIGESASSDSRGTLHLSWQDLHVWVYEHFQDMLETEWNNLNIHTPAWTSKLHDAYKLHQNHQKRSVAQTWLLSKCLQHNSNQLQINITLVSEASG